MAGESTAKDCLFVLLTGANRQPPSLTLHLITTTRDERKSHDTLSKLSAHLRQKSRKLHTNLASRVTFQAEQVDLTSLQSVHALSTHLLNTLPRLDVVFLNAGYGGLTGIDWLRAAWVIPTDLRYEITYPSYNLSAVGLTTTAQTSSGDEPPLGTVFTSNVFGHYILVHQLCPLFTSAITAQRSGRVIWISSIEGYASTFALGDMQGLAAESAYKSSKRLTDILILTSSRPSTQQYVSDFLGDGSNKSKKHEDDKREASRPDMYLAHPGICATSFVPLPFLLYWSMVLIFYLARWLGSPWHTVSSYKGAAAPVWLALALQRELDELEVDGKSKWGSYVSRGGDESVMRTEVEGWGVRGQVESLEGKELSGRRRGVRDLRMEEQERFEELGRECWQQIEELRSKWEQRLGW
ncbi:MAG: hypothetical protein Q9195_003850 [Heterodermia aff. obscurata]